MPRIPEGNILKKLESLTALRLFAAVPIVVEHSRPAFQSMGWISPNLPFDYGVSFFFVLSGFILSYAHRDFSSMGEIRNFYVSRAARIWPLHIFVLAAFFLVLPQNWWFFGWTDGHHLSIFLANLFLIHAWIPKVAYFFSFNAVSWSISTEMFFYLAFPFFRYQWKRTWHWKSALVILIVVAILSVATFTGLQPIDSKNPLVQSAPGWGYISPLVRMVEFVLGMLVWAAYDSTKQFFPRIGVAVWTGLEIGSILLIPVISTANIRAYIHAMGMDHFVPHFVPLALDEFIFHCAAAPAFALVVFVFAAGRGLLSKMIAVRPLIILGEASFALYLSHLLIYIAFTTYRSHFDAPDIVLCLGYWATAIVVSLLLWRFVETPARDWVRNRGRRDTIPTSAAV